MKLLNETSSDGGRVFWIVAEPIDFEAYETELKSLQGITHLEIKDRGDGSGTDVGLIYRGKRINIEVVYPYGTPLHPNARTVFVVEDRNCTDEVLESLLSDIVKQDIFIDCEERSNKAEI
jgi:hypothetical protein